MERREALAGIASIAALGAACASGGGASAGGVTSGKPGKGTILNIPLDAALADGVAVCVRFKDGYAASRVAYEELATKATVSQEYANANLVAGLFWVDDATGDLVGDYENEYRYFPNTKDDGATTDPTSDEKKALWEQAKLALPKAKEYFQGIHKRTVKLTTWEHNGQVLVSGRALPRLTWDAHDTPAQYKPEYGWLIAIVAPDRNADLKIDSSFSSRMSSAVATAMYAGHAKF